MAVQTTTAPTRGTNRYTPPVPLRYAGPTMFKKILIGLAAAAIFGSIASSGYSFGKYLARKGNPPVGQEAPGTMPRQ